MSSIYNKGVVPKKSFGQNFMIDENVNQKFITAIKSVSLEKKPIVEIGAGTGSLTAHLLKIADPLYSIERDRDLVPILNNRFKEEIKENKIYILEEDAKKYNIEQNCFLVGNLPYHLTSTLLLKALKAHEKIYGAVFMVQKEVALRIVALKNTKDYGIFSVIFPLFFDVSLFSNVSKNSFWPRPKVDSAIILLKPIKSPLPHEKIDEFFNFIKQIFQKRRKKLSTILGKDNLDLFFKANIDANLRPEDLSKEEFLALYFKMRK